MMTLLDLARYHRDGGVPVTEVAKLIKLLQECAFALTTASEMMRPGGAKDAIDNQLDIVLEQLNALELVPEGSEAAVREEVHKHFAK